jgi:hypothetical protein
MKLSIAPESTKMCLLAMACNMRKEMGTFIDQYLVIYTELQPNARTQAVGFEPFKNLMP